MGGMPLQHLNVVDYIGVDEDARRVALVMVAAEPWAAYEDPVALLEAKIRSYVFFVLDGQLWRRYPSFEDHVVYLRLDCAEEPGGVVPRALQALSVDLASRDIPFEVYWGDPPERYLFEHEDPRLRLL